MIHLLSYSSGAIGYGLSDDLDEAMKEAEERCAERDQIAHIVNRSTCKLLAVVERTPNGFKAKKME